MLRSPRHGTLFCFLALSVASNVLFSARTLAQTAPAETAPADDVLLEQLAGDSAERLKALRWVGARLDESPDAFFPPLKKCMDDEDVQVRRSVVMNIGQFMVWNQNSDKPHSQEAIDFLLKHTHDEDYRVIYNCVYYGLSPVTKKSDEVINRLIDIVLMRKPNEPLSVQQRVSWGFAREPKKTTAKIQQRLDKLPAESTTEAEMLTQMHLRISKEYPKNLNRFAPTSKYLIYLSVTPPFFPNDGDEVEAKLRERLGDDIQIENVYPMLNQEEYYAALLLTRLGDFASVVDLFADGRDFKVAYQSPPVPVPDEMQGKLEEQVAQGKEKSQAIAKTSYEAPFRELYDTLGKQYPCFELKNIDWQTVGDELLPLAKSVKTQAQFCLLCQELVARLEDSHAYLMKGTAEPAYMPVPRFDPGFACLIDDKDRPVIYYVDKGSPAEKAGLKIGMVITAINGKPVADEMAARMEANRKYVGYSSKRYLRYQTARWLGRQLERGSVVNLSVLGHDGKPLEINAEAALDVRYLPRLPVPIAGINDSANIAWKRLDDNIGYIYVRRIRSDLPEQLDAAVKELKKTDGLIIDVRGNSGGGFDSERALRNFNLNDGKEPTRPRYSGKIAILIDSRCISAGEGWSSWFQANDRATFFGGTTAGASGRKIVVDIMDGLYKVRFPVKAYKGFLDRPIERRGLEPDVAVRPNANDLANGIDTVLGAAKTHLLETKE